MNKKRFFKTLLITAIIFFVLSFLWEFPNILGIADGRTSFGFPLPFIESGGYIVPNPPTEFSFSFFIIDLTILLGISFLISWIIGKIKSRT